MQRLPARLCLAFLIPIAVPADTFVVLPFFNQSREPNLDWVGESLSEAVREGLLTGNILVLDRQDRNEVYGRLSIRPYAVLTHASVIKIGEALDSNVIYGRFMVSAEELPAAKASMRMSARVFNLRKMRQGPEFTEVGPFDELAAMQLRLAWQLLRSIAPEAAPTEEEFRRRRPVIRVDAIENYIRGLLAPPDQKHRFFAQASRLDPRFTQPCFQLGKMHWRSKNFRLAADWLQKVTPLDPHYREASFLLGLSRFQVGDYAGAEQSFKLVAASVPLNEVYNNLAAAQSRRNLPEAVDNFRKAVEGDSGDPVYHFNLGYALWKQGQYDAAVDSFRAAVERNPEDAEATLMLGRCLKRTGPRPNEFQSGGLERLKNEYQETAYLQLQDVLTPPR